MTNRKSDDDFLPEGMTEDEIEGLKEWSAEDSDADADDAKTDDAKTDDAKGGKEDAKDAKGDGDANADATDDNGGNASGVKQGDDSGKAVSAPELEPAVAAWKAPEGAENQLKELNEKRLAVAEQFDQGEITAKELIAQTAEIDAQIRRLERQIDRAEATRDQAERAWQDHTVPAFLADHPHYRDNPALLGLLDQEVRRLQVAASESGKNPLSPAILAAADQAIRDQLGKIGVALPAKTPAAKPEKSDQSLKPKIPPSIANLPATDITDTDDGRYSGLDRLAERDPVAYEAALARMSDAEREAYLRAQ